MAVKLRWFVAVGEENASIMIVFKMAY